MKRIEKQGIALNYVPLIGHNTIRASVMGGSASPCTQKQLLEMEKLVKDKKTYYKGEYDTKAKALRKRVVNWLRNNLNFQYENGLTIKDDIEDEIRNNSDLNSIPDYLQHMSKQSSYAGQIEITATANILKRSIRVYIMKNGTYSNVGLGYEIGKSKSKDIILFHNLI